MPDSWFQLELTHAVWPAGLAALPVLAYYFYRSLADFVRWQRVLSLVSRAVIVTLLVLSLAGLTLLKPTREQFVIFAIDDSLSVGDNSTKDVDEFIDKAMAGMGSNRSGPTW